MVGITAEEMEGIIYKLKRRLRQKLPKECYAVVAKEFENLEAYIEEKKAEVAPI